MRRRKCLRLSSCSRVATQVSAPTASKMVAYHTRVREYVRGISPHFCGKGLLFVCCLLLAGCIVLSISFRPDGKLALFVHFLYATMLFLFVKACRALFCLSSFLCSRVPWQWLREQGRLDWIFGAGGGLYERYFTVRHCGCGYSVLLFEVSCERRNAWRAREEADVGRIINVRFQSRPEEIYSLHDD